MASAAMAQAEDRATTLHQEALSFARAGEHPRALAQLADLRARFPERAQYHYDYIAILGWAERDAEVLQQTEHLSLEQLPPYMLETIGKSARNLKQYDLAIQAYQTAVARAPQRQQSRLGLALALSENSQGAQALALLASHRDAEGSDYFSLLEATAYAHISLKDYFAALACYEEILQHKPNHDGALRGRILMTHRLGAPHLAASMMKRHLGLLNSDEQAAIMSDVSAISIRWSRLPAHSDDDQRAQVAMLEQTVEALKQRMLVLSAAGKGQSRQYQRVAFDLMIALQVLQRMSEVTSLYQALVKQSAKFPKHALIAAADAYLQLKQPAKARDLYLEALSMGKPSLAVQLSLFYAYIENEEHERALELIDQLNKEQPRWKRLAGSSSVKENPNKVPVEITAAYARAYIDQLGQAQARLEPLHRQAPENLDIRSSLAYLYLWRGWPRRALEEFEIAGVQDSHHLDAALGRIHARYALYEFPTVEENIAALNWHYPESARLKGVNRMWALHNMRELRVDISRGISSGAQEGSRDLTLNSYLYGRPLRHRYRPYLHHLHSQARFPEGVSYYRRIGAGIEYRRRDLEVRSELARNLGGAADIGLNSSLQWSMDDHWSLYGNLDSYSNDVPLRGRAQGVDGWGVGAGVSYRFHELRRIDLSLKWLEFSDQNRRQSLGLSVDQRLITKVDYKLNGTASLYTSQNTRLDAPYFNPLSDLTLQLGVVNEWLLKRHYDYAYRHRLGLMVGQYQQKSYGGKLIWTVRYEHQWNFNDRTELRYAISRGQRAYDGVTEFITQFDLALVWRF